MIEVSYGNLNGDIHHSHSEIIKLKNMKYN